MPSFLFLERRTAEIGVVGAQLDIIQFDAMLAEQHSSEYEITEHPVEDGVSISDHKRQKPRRLTLTGVMSNTPIELLGIGGDDKRDVNSWELLKEMQAADGLVAVFTTLEQHENLQIESLSVPRDVARGNSLEVTITLREVNIVESATVEARKGEQQGKRPPKRKLDKQNKATKPPNDSILGKIIKGAVGA